MLVHHRTTSIKLLQALLLPLDGILVHCRVTPRICYVFVTVRWKPIHLLRQVDRDDVNNGFFAKETQSHNADQTRTNDLSIESPVQKLKRAYRAANNCRSSDNVGLKSPHVQDEILTLSGHNVRTNFFYLVPVLPDSWLHWLLLQQIRRASELHLMAVSKPCIYNQNQFVQHDKQYHRKIVLSTTVALN